MKKSPMKSHSHGARSNNGGAGGRRSITERSDKKSATGMSGSPKKRGHGGKYTWSGDGYSQAEIGFEGGAIDVNDPNFEDTEDQEEAVTDTGNVTG